MTRYVENLNECTDPVAGDMMHIYDASAGSTDKDRRVNASRFAILSVANVFTANYIQIASADGGADAIGPSLRIGRNSNASTPSSGCIAIYDKNNVVNKIWIDAAGNARVYSAYWPTGSNDTAGTVIGTQTSSLDAKDIAGEPLPIDDVLAAVRAGAEAVRRFTYKSGSFNGQEFSGVVVDYAPRYGMDRDDEHPAGKSLNVITVIGDLLLAVSNLAERVAALEAAQSGA